MRRRLLKVGMIDRHERICRHLDNPSNEGIYVLISGKLTR